jgi:hypothetical protein
MVGIYEITRDGRSVASGLFKSADEIFDVVRAQPTGVYDVYKELPSDSDGVRNSEYWGQVTKDEAGGISCSSVSDPRDASLV